jgi:NADPH:quinone reductase-like Zn-dependent oxidoreductase
MYTGAALAAAVATNALPSEMPALVASSAAKQEVTIFKTPKLGDLHSKFDNLPDSCEVLVAISHSSVNPADTYPSAPFPQVMGSDLSGTVVETQDTCKRLKVGDKVWADIGAVTEFGGSKGKENGAYAPLAVALESQLGHMPKNLDFEEAAALPKVALTGYKAMTWYGGAPYTSSNGTFLLLGGSGGTGTVGIQLAKALGATKVITTCSAENAEYVKSLGADEVIDYHSANWWEVLDKGSVNAIYDCVGQAGTGDNAMPILAEGGYYVTLRGQLPTSVPKGKHASAFINSDTNLDNVDLLDALRDLAEAEKLRFAKRKSYDLVDVLAAFNESAGGHVDGKLVIKMPALSADAVVV